MWDKFLSYFLNSKPLWSGRKSNNRLSISLDPSRVSCNRILGRGTSETENRTFKPPNCFNHQLHYNGFEPKNTIQISPVIQSFPIFTCKSQSPRGLGRLRLRLRRPGRSRYRLQIFWQHSWRLWTRRPCWRNSRSLRWYPCFQIQTSMYLFLLELTLLPIIPYSKLYKCILVQ